MYASTVPALSRQREQAQWGTDESAHRLDDTKRPGVQHVGLTAAMLARDAPFAKVFAVVAQSPVAGFAES